LQRTADRLLAPEVSGAWNQAMMELGGTICTPRSPQCLLCPVAKFCRARKLGLQEVIPEKRKKRATVGVQLAAAVLVDDRSRCILLSPPKKSTEKALPGDIPTLVSKMWHFPTTVVSKDPASDLRRYLKNIIGVKSLPSRFVALPKIHHAVTYRAISLLPFHVQFKKLPRVVGAKVILLKDFSSLPVSNLTRKVARAALEAPGC
jgi:A/G-specific adenine glycosylase